MPETNEVSNLRSRRALARDGGGASVRDSGRALARDSGCVLARDSGCVLARDSGRKHKAWGGARLCECNPRIELLKGVRAHEMGDSVHCVDAVSHFTGSDMFSLVILGSRSQSLAPPQALCLRPLSRAKSTPASRAKSTPA